MNPPPWKKITTGRDVVLVLLPPPAPALTPVGVKRRNQILLSASTVMSFVETPLMGVALADVLLSKKLRRRRLTLPLDRHAASVKVIINEIERRVFKGKGSLGFFSVDIVKLRFVRCSMNKLDYLLHFFPFLFSLF